MGWKGTLRAIQATQRRAERDARQRQRELARRSKDLQKLQELEQAVYEVELYENRLELLTSVHKDCGETWDWDEIKNSEPPSRPVKKNTREQEAQKKLDNFKPGIIDKAFGRTESKRNNLIEELENAIRIDEEEYKKELEEHESEYKEWKETKVLAEKILEGDQEAYGKAVKEINPFSEISELGSSISFQFKNSSIVEVTVSVNSEEVIPKEVKSLSKTGKLLTKNMPKGQFYELYQDYICSGVLRVARELFALLPINMIIVHAMGELLNTKTGYLETVKFFV